MDRNKILTNRAFYKQLTDNDPVAQARALALCQKDIVFWVNHFCWCHEPRTSTEFPMVLFDYQSWALREWEEHITHNHGDMVIEKCRDMGITWIILYLFLYFWMFRPNSSFLISSFREQEVDYQNSMAALFPKLRFVVEHLPDWMKPQGYNPKNHATYMRLYNPENSSIILGSAPISNYGRSGRFKAVLYDEHAQWQYGQAAWDAASRTSDNRISLSTPYGKDNAYAQLALDEDNVRIIYPGSVA